MYALRFKEGTEMYKEDVSGRLIGFTVISNDGAEFCNSTTVKLSMYSDNGVWVVMDEAVAKTVCETNTEWYNAGFESPENPFVGKLEVVELAVVKKV